jgi:A/G-specific adenine glycosylase
VAGRRPGAIGASEEPVGLEDLVAWFRRHARDLPWRAAPLPYPVWVSEVMLQQTRVATALPYFSRWMERFPSIAALAAAPEDAVLGAWAGLGYYSRARALHAAARRVVAAHGGRLPSTADELRRLPGIGRYTAGAIASIAFDEATPVVDGNVARVLARWQMLDGDPRREPLQSRLWALAQHLVVRDRPGDVNQALMELGAVVCTPRSPACAGCPIRAHCRARAAGAVDAYPQRVARPAPLEVSMVASVVWRAGRVLVVRAPQDARWWPGMWHFPAATLGPREAPARAAARAAEAALGCPVPPGAPLMAVRHTVTRHRVTLEVFVARLPGGNAGVGRDPGRRWRRPADLDSLAMPAPHRRIARRLALP